MYKASVVGQIELNTANAKSPASSSSSSSNLSAAACLEPEDAELGVLFSTPRLLRPVFDSVVGTDQYVTHTDTTDGRTWQIYRS